MPFDGTSTLDYKPYDDVTFNELFRVLGQLNPEFVKKVIIGDVLDGPANDAERFFNLPQLNTIIRLEIGISAIKDSQLETLKPPEMKLGQSRNVTSNGINKLIKNRIDELNTRSFSLSIAYPFDGNCYQKITDGLDSTRAIRVANPRCENLIFVIHTPFPRLKLRVFCDTYNADGNTYLNIDVMRL